MEMAMPDTLSKAMGIPEFSVGYIVLDFIVVPDDNWFWVYFQLVLSFNYSSRLDLLNGTVWF